MSADELILDISEIVISDSGNEQMTVDQSIMNIIKKEGYITYDVKKKELMEDCGNVFGILYEVDVTGKKKDSFKTTAIFIKTLPPIKFDLGMSLQLLYDKENFVYHNLSKKFDKLQIETAIPENKRYKMVKSYEETHPKAVFLENIARKGFRTWFRMDVVTLDYAEECIKQLARFHALSFALEIKEPGYFNRFIKPLEFGSKPGNAREELYDIKMNLSLRMLDSSDKERLEGELRKILGNFDDYIAAKDAVCCLCHGDYKPNNIMYKTVEGRITEMIPVDYQLVNYGCPVLDIIHFIYLSTDHQFRKKHLPYLKDLYHETLTDFLNYFNISVDSVFPKNLFEELYEKKKIFGLSVTMFIGPVVFTELPFEDLIDQSKRHVGDDRFKIRLYDAIKEFFDV